MISKELLSHSLHSSYRELLSSKTDDPDFLKKEIIELAENAEIFSEKEIEQHKEAFLLMEKLSLKNKISCHVDGSVRIVYEKKSDSLLKKRVVGAGAAYIIESEGEILSEQGVPLPLSFMEEDMTSHIAEYHALIACLDALFLHYPLAENLDVEIETDSEVLCNQMTYTARTRNIRHQKLKEQALEKMQRFHSVSFKKIPRESNGWADRLARTSYQT